jgi:hypothetical protein
VSIRLAGLGIMVLLAVLTAAAVTILDPVAAPPPLSPAEPRPRESVPAITVAEFLDAGGGPSFDTSGQRGYPSGDVGQSKLWYADGAWWAVLVADGTSEYRIHRFDWAQQIWIDSGTHVAARSAVQPDVLWADGHLYVVTGGADPESRNATSLLRFSFDGVTGRHILDPDFPVRVSDQQAYAVTIARDRAGHLWLAYTHADRLWLNRSVDNDWNWQEPFVPDLAGTGVALDAAVVVALDDTVAVVWSNQVEDAVYLAVHGGGDAQDWQPQQVAVEGLMHADDHINVAVLPGDDGDRLFVALKTSLDELPNRNPYDPQILVLVREPDGEWRQYLAGRIQDRHSRPIVVIDEDQRLVYLFATSPFSGGTIYYKVASVDAMSFAAGTGVPVIVSDDDPRISSVTSSKQNVGAASGLVVLASDSTTGRYLHAAATLGGDPVAVTEPAPAWEAPVPRRLLNDEFDPFPDGAQIGNRWRVRTSGDSSVTIASTDDGRRVARASTGDNGSRIRFCKAFDTVTEGQLRVEADVSLLSPGRSDAVITALRMEGAESAVVRFARSGVFAFYDGEEFVASGVAYQLGAWYRSTMVVHLDDATYDWEVRRMADDVVLVSLRGLTWRTPTAGGANEVCLQTPAPRDGDATLLLDRVLVEH